MLWHVDNQKPMSTSRTQRCRTEDLRPGIHSGIRRPPSPPQPGYLARFEPTLVELLRGQPRGSVLYKGVNWNVMTFQSTLFPLRAGEVTASGTVTARAALPEADPLIANFIRSGSTGEMAIPEVKITARELPGGASSSFTNAVGISASPPPRMRGIPVPMNPLLLKSG